MADYGKYCPVALGTEVIADRWTPLILRELFLGSTRFNDIARGLPGISRTLLVQRLKHLERKGVIDRWPAAAGRGHEYRLTPAGKDLERVVETLGRWSLEWLYHEYRPRDIDAQTLTWWMHRRVDREHLPPRRVVVQFDHTAPVRETLWVVLDRGEVSVCNQHPGFDADIVVTCTTPALADVFVGLDNWSHAAATGAVTVAGSPQLVRGLSRWFRPSPFADSVEEISRRAADGFASAR